MSVCCDSETHNVMSESEGVGEGEREDERVGSVSGE